MSLREVKSVQCPCRLSVIQQVEWLVWYSCCCSFQSKLARNLVDETQKSVVRRRANSATPMKLLFEFAVAGGVGGWRAWASEQRGDQPEPRGLRVQRAQPGARGGAPHPPGRGRARVQRLHEEHSGGRGGQQAQHCTKGPRVACPMFFVRVLGVPHTDGSSGQKDALAISRSCVQLATRPARPRQVALDVACGL